MQNYAIIGFKERKHSFPAMELIAGTVLLLVSIVTAIPLYVGLRQKSEIHAEQIAISAAQFLSSVKNQSSDWSSPHSLQSGGSWVYSIEKNKAVDYVVWTCPANTTIRVSGSTLVAMIQQGRLNKISRQVHF